MTARQIMDEIEMLPFDEQREVFSSLKERLEDKAPGTVAYADRDEALRMADRILTERAELFQKLAQ